MRYTWSSYVTSLVQGPTGCASRVAFTAKLTLLLPHLRLHFCVWMWKSQSLVKIIVMTTLGEVIFYVGSKQHRNVRRPCLWNLPNLEFDHWYSVDAGRLNVEGITQRQNWQHREVDLDIHGCGSRRKDREAPVLPSCGFHAIERMDCTRGE